MHLKSEGFASTLYDPAGEFRLARYCRDEGIPYADIGLPVKRQVFTDYGQAFARRYVPALEDRHVAEVATSQNGFELTLQDGERLTARYVICAVGITHYCHIAKPFLNLPPELVSHSSTHTEFSRFAGKRVAVVGSGASATDCAALLSEAGAITHLVTRRPAVSFHEPPRPRSLKEKIKAPRTSIGSGWQAVFYAGAPGIFQRLPASYRVATVRAFAGPAACWFVREQIDNHVELHCATRVARVTPGNQHVTLHFENPAQPPLEVDHVLTATGYRVNLDRLGFFEDATRQRLNTIGGAPVLSQKFESSLPGLFFVGPSAANSFGPLQRFACGAQFAAGRMAKQLG
jgi:thioredoxin reductase